MASIRNTRITIMPNTTRPRPRNTLKKRLNSLTRGGASFTDEIPIPSAIFETLPYLYCILIVGLLVVSIAGGFGVILGAIAGYFGGVVGAVIMRLMDTLMTIPLMILAMLISSLLGGGLKNVVIALGFGLIPGYARMMTAQVLVAKETDYVMAEHAMGASNARIVIRHIVPNCFSPILVMMTMMMGTTILAEAGLSFIGIGITPPTPAWGSMVTDGRNYLLSNPMLSIAPGVAIMLLVFSFNMVGDGLRDALDPRLRGII